jgi:polyhydroxybutyrate depolymerase
MGLAASGNANVVTHSAHVKTIVSSLLVVAVLAQSSPALAAEPAPFPDMRTSWYLYREAVAVLKDRGVIGGYQNGMFKPRATVNRAEFLKIVFAAKESEGGVAESCFTDVPQDAWFAPYVCAAKRRGIAEGYADGTFKPEQEVNWAEAIALVSRTYGWDVDEREGERWYEPFVETFDRRDVLPEHSYVPWQPLSRERAADLVYRMLQFERGVTFEKSPGCVNGDGRAPTGVESNGVQRSFLITAPAAAKGDVPVPLLFGFHGRTNSNAQVKNYMRFEREATDAIVVYPAGMPASGGGYSWTGEGGADVAFFDAMVEEIGKHLCVDMDRIYVAGHSLGAWMANSLACLRGGVVRASATVGGDGIVTNCTGPTAGFISHNPKDESAPFSGSVRVRETRVAQNACSWDVKDAPPKALSCERHAGCQGGNDVLWCPHTIDTDERGEFYPHTWPRGTGKYMVEFFRTLE